MPNHPKIKGIYAITDATLIPDKSLLHKVEQAILGGISILQFRDKRNDLQEKLKIADSLAKLCKQHQVTFIINDDIHLAKKVNADGVHLGKNDDGLLKAREALGKKAIVGCSCYNSIELAKKAQQHGADYVAFGRFFPSKTKPDAVQADISLLTQAKKSLNIPIVAIGGIEQSNAESLVNNGANALAIIYAIWSRGDIKRAVRELKKICNR